jgi:hypothetical protein
MLVAEAFAIVGYADRGESSEANLRFVMVCLGVIVAVGALAVVPMVLARRRGHRREEKVTGLTVLWALVLGGSILVSETARVKWAREQTIRIQSGYYDPQDVSDAPRYPWELWAALGVAYGGLVAWAGMAKAR